MLTHDKIIEIFIKVDDFCVSSLKLQLSSGLASGNIFISDKIKNGDYELRAYTRWMRNFGEESFFKPIYNW